MGGLFKQGGVDPKAPVIASMQIQTSSFGRPIPWVFGRRRVAPNLIQYADFTSHERTTQQRTGKGGGGGGSTDYTYSAAAIMALSTGQLASIGKVWKDKETTSLAELNLDFYDGSEDQEPYSYFVSKHPDEALGYRGIAYVASGSYDLGTQATLGAHTFEVQARNSIADTRPGSLVPDAQLADVVVGLLTDPGQGVGLDPSTLADLSAWRSFCLANSLWVSPAYIEQRGAFEYIKNLLTIGFADCVYSGGKFKIVPYSDVPASGALGTYAPAIAPVVDLTDDDFLFDGGDDVIRIVQRSAEDTYNHVRVRFADRANDYNDNVAEVKDQADIELHGLRSMDVVDMKEIADAAVAQKVAAFLLHRSLYIVNTYEFRLSWKHVRLEPMDVVTLTYPRKYLDRTPVLITDIEEDDDGMLTVRTEDYPLGSNSHRTQGAPDISSTVPNYAVAPGNANPPVMFEPPAKLTGGATELWMAVSGGPDWGGAVVWASLDDQSYQRVGSVRGRARHGVLAAPLAAGTAIDTANVLAVNLAVSRGELVGASEVSARDLLTACYVGGEYIAYANEVLAGPHAYRLSYLVRGGYGSDIGAHAAGTPFVFLDSAVFRYAFPSDWIGKTVYVKLTSYNQFGGALQDVSAVPRYACQLVGGKVGNPSYLGASERVFGIQLDWVMPLGGEFVEAVEIWWGESQNRNSAALLCTVAAPQTSYTVTGLPAGVTRYFWIRLVDQAGNKADFYPSDAGVAGSSASDAKVILDWLTGQIGKTQLAKDLLSAIDLVGSLADIRDAIGASHLNGIIAANNAAIKEATARAEAVTAEAQARADGLLGEAQARANGLLDEARARGAAITSVQTSVQTATESLASRIDTVSAATDQAAAAVRQETTARATATDALAQQITTVAARTDDNAAAIVSESTARADQGSALATVIDSVTARTGSNEAAIVDERTARTTAVESLGTSLSVVSARTGENASAIIEERKARTDAVSAVSSSLDALTARTGSNEAMIADERTARTTAVDSLATAQSLLSASTAANASAILDERKARTDAVSAVSTSLDTLTARTNGNEAAIADEKTARTTAVDSLATSLSVLSASTDANASAILDEKKSRTDAVTAVTTSLDALTARTDSAEAAIATEKQTRATEDSALSKSITALTTRVGTAEAAIVSEQTTRTDADSAAAKRIDTLQATANGAAADVKTNSEALAATNGKLSAMHTIKTRVTTNGKTYMAGIGLGVEVNGQEVESQVLLAAQRVAIIDADGSAVQAPFVVQDGQVFINQAFIGSASIGTLKLAGNAVTVPFVGTGIGTWPGIGQNMWQTVVQGTIHLDQPGMVFAASTGYIEYGQGWVAAGSRLLIDGAVVSLGGGEEAWDNAAHSGGKQCNAGDVLVQLQFHGRDSRVRIINPSIYVQGAKR